MIARKAARGADATGMSTDAFAIMRHLCDNFICISLRNTREQCDLRDYHEQQSIPLSIMIDHLALCLTDISSANSHAHCQDCISDSSESNASSDCDSEFEPNESSDDESLVCDSSNCESSDAALFFASRRNLLQIARGRNFLLLTRKKNLLLFASRKNLLLLARKRNFLLLAQAEGISFCLRA